MRGLEAEQPDDAEELSRALKGLASPVRIRILRALRSPKRPGDVRVRADHEHDGLSAERVLTRPAVTQHVEVLEDLGLVRRLPDDGRFVVDQPRVFALLESLGRLARLRPVVDLDPVETMEGADDPERRLPAGPRLLLASGPREGEALALEGEGPWIVGRAPGCALRLEYDPHVSREHLRVARAPGGGFAVEPLPAKNPTRLNLAELPTGRSAPLAAGALLHVGSTRLVFQAA